MFTNREVVKVGSKGHHDGGGDALLQQAAQLALGVNLGTESGHAEVVLGANGGDTLLLETTAHHATSGGHEAEAHVDTGLNLVRDLPPVRRVESSHGSLQLSGGDPVLSLVACAVRDGALRALSEGRALPQSLHAEGEFGGDGLEVAADEDASHAPLQEGRVQHLERSAEVIAGVLVLELGHVLAAGGDGELRLGDELVGPAVVEASGQSAFIVEVALGEDLEESQCQ